MSNFRGRRRLLWALLVLVVLALAGCSLLRRGGASDRLPDYEPAELTDSSPAVDELRAAVKGANVVICIIDAARADHVGCYGYPRETTPNIDRLAGRGMVFDKHFVQYPETKPSTACLFTGQYPDTHLAYGTRMPAESSFTFARGLRAAGFHTVLFSQNGYASPMWGLGTHFHEAYYEPHLKAAGRDLPWIWQPEALLEQTESWLEKRPRTPFFAYVHFMPPHDPYIAPPHMYSLFMDEDPPNALRGPYPFEEVEQDLRRREKPWSQRMFLNRYDGHFFYADWAVGELARQFREAGLFDSTLFIVTADHGEAFGEHGYKGHTTSAYDECIHVPLVMKFPGAGGPTGRVTGLTQVIDLLPTIFDLFELPYPRDGIQGRSLLPLMAGEVEEVNDYIFARTAGDPPSYVVRDQRSLLLLYRGGRPRALYDLENDPRAVENVIAEQPQRAAELVEVFRRFAEAQTAPPMHFLDPNVEPPPLPEVEHIQVTEEIRREFRALGYIR